MEAEVLRRLSKPFPHTMRLTPRRDTSPTSADRDNITDIVESLRSIVKALRASRREAEQKLGISSAQLYILQELQDRPAQSINQLAKRTYTHQSSVSNVVAKLVEQNLVTRSAARSDARRVSLSLSPAGRAIMKKAPSAGQGTFVDALRDMRSGDLEDLARTLHTLTRSLERAGPFGSDQTQAQMEA
jgi:DNA-binding MarR family transcriptional regulator